MLTPEVLAELRRRYGEPHRAFHDWARVAELIDMAEEVAGGIGDRTAFILAILFHRAVFDPRLPDAAGRSVATMHELIGASLPGGTLDRAAMLIRAVSEQQIPQTEDPSLRGDAALLLDFEHAVLGSEEARYTAYEAAIRREFPHLPDDRYRQARAATLTMHLWKDRIFITDRFHLDREKRARRNIAKAIAALDDA